jgi:hypothetical protein
MSLSARVSSLVCRGALVDGLIAKPEDARNGYLYALIALANRCAGIVAHLRLHPEAQQQAHAALEGDAVMPSPPVSPQLAPREPITEGKVAAPGFLQRMSSSTLVQKIKGTSLPPSGPSSRRGSLAEETDLTQGGGLPVILSGTSLPSTGKIREASLVPTCYYLDGELSAAPSLPQPDRHAFTKVGQ